MECLDAENLRPHYAKTLWHWVERLDAHKQKAIALVGEEKYRVWRAYMAGFAFAFERGWDRSVAGTDLQALVAWFEREAG